MITLVKKSGPTSSMVHVSVPIGEMAGKKPKKERLKAHDKGNLESLKQLFTDLAAGIGEFFGEEEVEKMNKAAVMNCEYSGAAYYSTLFMLLSKYVGCDAKLEPAADRRGFQLIAPLKEEQLDMQNIANCARLIAEKNAV